MSLKGKLQLYKKHLTIEHNQAEEKLQQQGGKANKEEDKVNQQEDKVNQQKDRVNQNGFKHASKWQELQCSPRYYESEWIMERKVFYPPEHKHGLYSFAQLQDVINRWNERKEMHPLSARSYSSQDLLFFDTETTGLGGGVGNTIFLLGYGEMIDAGFQVTQLFLPSPASEVALYYHFLEDIREKKRLVTYNGKAFDWPQVKTRHTLLRDELQQLPPFGHYDLLHAARRLWKGQLESCRLSLVEEEILNYHRTEDTPGYMAPILYFDYLQSENPLTVAGVFQHNEWDICSLVSLYIHLSTMLLVYEEKDSVICNPRELVEIGRWYEAVGELPLASVFYQKAIQFEGSHVAQAKQKLAYMYKKMKLHEQARSIWEEISVFEHYSIESNIELAKLNEHIYKDYEKALFYVEKAVKYAQATGRPQTNSRQYTLADLHTRSERLQRKLMSREVEQDYNLFSEFLEN